MQRRVWLQLFGRFCQKFRGFKERAIPTDDELALKPNQKPNLAGCMGARKSLCNVCNLFYTGRSTTQH